MANRHLTQVALTYPLLGRILCLPVGHNVISAVADPSCQQVNVVLEGHSFPAVLEGGHLPLETQTTRNLANSVMVDRSTVTRLQSALEHGELHKYLLTEDKGADLTHLTEVLAGTRKLS